MATGVERVAPAVDLFGLVEIEQGEEPARGGGEDPPADPVTQHAQRQAVDGEQGESGQGHAPQRAGEEVHEQDADEPTTDQ